MTPTETESRFSQDNGHQTKLTGDSLSLIDTLQLHFYDDPKCS